MKFIKKTFIAFEILDIVFYYFDIEGLLNSDGSDGKQKNNVENHSTLINHFESVENFT